MTVWIAAILFAAILVTDASAAGTRGENSTRATAASSQSTAPRRLRARPRIPVLRSTFITFDEFEEETVVTDQYAPEGVVFSGPSEEEEPEIAYDESNPTTPVLSGTPDSTDRSRPDSSSPEPRPQAVVNGLAVDVGFLDDPGDVHLVIHTVEGDEVLTPEEFGINTMESEATDITGFTVEEDGEEEAGFAIDNLTFDPGVALPPPPPPPPPPLPSPTPAPVATPAPSCAPYLLIDSRGSGEPIGELSHPGRGLQGKARQRPEAETPAGQGPLQHELLPGGRHLRLEPTDRRQRTRRLPAQGGNRRLQRIGGQG